MMENDDRLIKDFLLAGKQEVADNGFSRRVMYRLPSHKRAQRLSGLISAACFIVCMACLYISDGIEVLWQTTKELFAQQAYQVLTEGNPQALFIGLAVLGCLCIHRAWSLE